MVIVEAVFSYIILYYIILYYIILYYYAQYDCEKKKSNRELGLQVIPEKLKCMFMSPAICRTTICSMHRFIKTFLNRHVYNPKVTCHVVTNTVWCVLRSFRFQSKEVFILLRQTDAACTILNCHSAIKSVVMQQDL
jgi:hypothetical protein